jgi:hypothetical protein
LSKHYKRADSTSLKGDILSQPLSFVKKSTQNGTRTKYKKTVVMNRKIRPFPLMNRLFELAMTTTLAISHLKTKYELEKLSLLVLSK